MSEMYFLMALEAVSPRSGCQQGWFPCPWCAGAALFCIPIWPFLCVCTSLVSLPLLLRTAVLLDLGPTHMTSFKFDYLLTGLISKYSRILRYWGLRLQYMIFGKHNSAHNISQLKKLIERYILVLGMYQVHERK